ncbi:hypothetical protein EG832_17575 [bacterium]|nr:hypothetical protein [bacterium]
MKGNRIQFYGVVFSLLLLAGAFSVQAQTGSGDTSDSTGTDAGNNKHSFYAGTGYGNNLLYLGTTMSQDNGFGYLSASYGFADKLYLSATGYSVFNFSPITSFYSLGISFSQTFNSWFDISSSLSRYNVAESLRDTLFSNFTYADATLGFDWRILYTKFSAGGLFAGGGQFYMQIRNSRYFETPTFAGDKAFFSFDPYVNCLFGTMLTIHTSDGMTETTLSPGYKPWRKRGQVPGPVPVTTYSKFFGAMEIDFGIPVAFSYDSFTLEIEPGYVIPLYSDEGASGTSGFLLSASLFFRIF